MIKKKKKKKGRNYIVSFHDKVFNVTVSKRIILNVEFVFMTFVQNQETTMPDSVGYITELMAHCLHCGQLV